MRLNKNLQKRRNCLEECGRSQEICETGSEGRKSCKQQFEDCTTMCEFDHA